MGFLSTRPHVLHGSHRDVVEAGRLEDLEEWLQDLREALPRAMGRALSEIEGVLSDPEWAAAEFTRTSREALEEARSMVVRRSKPTPRKSPAKKKKAAFKLPVDRRVPDSRLEQYAFHITGERKIGKTSLAIEGCEELVLQFDKPQLAYKIREVVPECWSDFRGAKVGFVQVLSAIEEEAENGPESFPYERIVVDGVSEWYAMCQEWACKQHGVAHPSENDNWGATWSLLRETFLDAVNRLLRLQITAGCGLIFISHAEWKTRKQKGGPEVTRLESDLPNRCEKTINGKVDGWFAYDYVGSKRVLYVKGDAEIGAGHRIDGHFMTKDGRRVTEIYMGDETTDAAFSLSQLQKAFNNELEEANLKEATVRGSAKKKRGTPAKRKVAKK